MGTSTDMVLLSWLDGGDGGGVDSGIIPCSLRSSARLTVGTFTGFSTAAGADVADACGAGCCCCWTADTIGVVTGTATGCGGVGAGCSTAFVVMTGWWVTMFAGAGVVVTTLVPPEMRGVERAPWW